MLRNILKIAAIFIFGIGGGIFADQILWPYFIERPLFYQYRLEQSPVYLTERKEIIIRENNALTLAVEKGEKTVIGVRTKTAEGLVLEGSGLIITSDGLIVTLASLVPQGSSFSFWVEGKAQDFQILKRDLENDLALVKLVAKEPLATVGFADSQRIKLGERVILIGAVFEGKIMKKTANEGIIRSFQDNLIETNIIEENNLAGSPLFNIEGEVLGLNKINSKGQIVTVSSTVLKIFTGF